MGRSSYATSPDGGVVDVDRGSGDVSTKLAAVVSVEDARERRDTRAGARDLDATVESMPGLNRQQRDRERSTPRSVPGDVPDPRMERTLPAAGAMRVPMSARQRGARSVTKGIVQDSLPATQFTAVDQMITDSGHWRRTNDALSDAAGDVQQLDDTQMARVQRVDRAIMAYERASNRSHVVYANVRLPPAINASNMDGFARNTFPAGTEVCFDRFTAGAHNLHQMERTDRDADRTAAFEIQTRRGAYLGRSTSSDNTSHLLPRGLQLRVVGTHTARYTRPDGTIGQRQIIQLTDQ